MTRDEPQPAYATDAEQDSRRDLSPRPILKIVKGDATPEEVAALVAVVAALGGGSRPPKRPTPEWSAHHRKPRRTLSQRPGGWRSSALPN